MYKILLHVCGIAIIEIVFYFMYIGPMESNIFKNAIEKSFIEDTNNDDKTIKVTSPFNITQIITIENGLDSNLTETLKDSSYEAVEKRNKYNTKLYDYAIYIWTMLFIFTIAVALLQLAIKYYYFKKSKTSLEKVNSVSNMAIEMSRYNSSDESNNNYNRSDEIRSLTNESNINNEIIINDEDKFINIKKIKKEFLKKGIYYILLSGSLILFEYLFFNYIILKYHIISKEEMEYILYQIMNPLVKGYIELKN